MADAMSLFTIDLCAGWARVGEAPAAAFDGVIRHLAAGEWRLEGPVAGVALEPGIALSDIDTIRVVRDATIIYAGIISPVASGIGGLTITDDGAGPAFTLTGADAWAVLASRVAYPTPSTGPPWADGWDIRTGQASTAAAGYVEANAGASALAARRIPGLTIVDGHAGLSGSWSARLQPLDQLVARVCRDGGITCRLAIDFAGALTATFAAPTDRHTSVVVSDQGDLSKLEQIRVPAGSTFVIAGGQGNLTARTFATAGAATGSARHEAFSDQTSLSTGTEVQQAADRVLAAGAPTLTVRAEITDDAATDLVYGVDYEIGDLISVEVADVRYSVSIDSVTVSVSEERAVIRPVLGAAAPDLVTGLIRDVSSLASRLDSSIS